MTRKEQREAAFLLLFEREFKIEEQAEAVFAVSSENRDIDGTKEKYVKKVFFGVVESQDEIDALISGASNGWKISRLSRATRSALRLAVYEMLYCEDVPSAVSINEALELVKKYDEPRARAFANGVLNAVKDRIEKKDD